MSDITVTVCIPGSDSRAYALHKLVLMQSPFFRAMLRGCWKESEASQLELQIDDPNITREAVTMALESLYHEGAVELTPWNQYQVMAAAEYLQIQHLQERCLDFIVRNVGVATVIDAIQFAHRSQCRTELLKGCSAWLKRHLPALARTEQFCRIPVDVFAELIGADDLWVRDEFERFRLARQFALQRVEAERLRAPSPRGPGRPPAAGPAEPPPGADGGAAPAAAQAAAAGPSEAPRALIDLSEGPPLLEREEGRQFAPVFAGVHLFHLQASEMKEVVSSRMLRQADIDEVYRYSYHLLAGMLDESMRTERHYARFGFEFPNIAELELGEHRDGPDFLFAGSVWHVRVQFDINEEMNQEVWLACDLYRKEAETAATGPFRNCNQEHCVRYKFIFLAAHEGGAGGAQQLLTTADRPAPAPDAPCPAPASSLPPSSSSPAPGIPPAVPPRPGAPGAPLGPSGPGRPRSPVSGQGPQPPGPAGARAAEAEREVESEIFEDEHVFNFEHESHWGLFYIERERMAPYLVDGRHLRIICMMKHVS
eukprot:tig00000615_g2551.t1